MNTPTPFFEFVPDAAATQLAALRAAFDGRIDVLYAVKANPDPMLLAELRGAGSGVEVASIGELELVQRAGFDPRGVLFTNPLRTAADSAAALRAGLRWFVLDSFGEVDRLSEAAGQAGVDPVELRCLIRLQVDQGGADVPLGDKFGLELSYVGDLAAAMLNRGLRSPEGVSFHVGSQVANPATYRRAGLLAVEALEHLAAANRLAGRGVIDVGGGWPAAYEGVSATVEACAAELRAGLGDWARRATLIAEPGRFIAAPAFRLHTTVTGVAVRNGQRWAHLDAGVYNGVMDPAFAEIRLPVSADSGGELGEWVLAGPTCDSIDVVDRRAALPVELHDGDRVTLELAGAYSVATQSTFNGFDLTPVVWSVRGAEREGSGT